MPSHAGPNTAGESNIVFSYDTGDTSNSYRGEPTVNLHPNPEDVSSWTGNLFNNWINSSVTSNASIAPNGTLTADRLGDGYGRFNTSVSITAGQTYTYSVYLKNVNLTNGFGIVYAWGLNGSLVSYGTAYNVSIAEISTGEWTRITTTITAPGSGVNQVQFGPCPFTGYGNPSGQQLDVWGGHIENKSHATPYINGTRSATQGLLPLIGNTSIDISTVSFDSNAQMTFDGTDDNFKIDVNSTIRGYTAVTFESIHKATSDTGGATPYNLLTSPNLDGNADGFWHHWVLGGQWYWRLEDNVNGEVGNVFSGATPFETNKWYHVVAVVKTNTILYYLNGSLIHTVNTSFAWANLRSDNTAYLYLGSGYGDNYFFSGNIPVFKMYNTEISADQVKQNYQQYKTRFNLS